MMDTYTGLEVEEDCAGNVASVVGLSLLDCIPRVLERGACLVEEDVFPVAALCRKVLEVSVLVYAMLLA